MEETVKKLNDFINETFNDNDDFLLNRGINSKIRENPQIKPLLDKMTSYLKQIEDDLSKLNELELENKTHSTSIITTRSKQRQILSDYNINIAKYKLQIVKERLNCSELYSQLLLKERDTIGSEQEKIRMEVKTLKKLVNDLELENDVFTTDLSVIREYIRQPGCQILTKDNLLYNDFLLYQRWLLSKLHINGTDSINENDNIIETAISTLLSEVDQLDEQRFECGMKDKTINGLKSQIRVLDKTNNELDNERRELILSIENHKNMNEGQTHKLSTLLDTMNKNENRLVSDNNRLIYDNSILNSENAKLDLEVKILKNSVIEKNADIIDLEYRLNNSELEKNDLIKSVLALVPELEYSPQTGFSLKCDYEVIDTNDINIK
jgi:chromosome segregation ATPase